MVAHTTLLEISCTCSNVVEAGTGTSMGKPSINDKKCDHDLVFKITRIPYLYEVGGRMFSFKNNCIYLKFHFHLSKLKFHFPFI